MKASVHYSPALHHRSPALGYTLVARDNTGLVAGQADYAFATRAPFALLFLFTGPASATTEYFLCAGRMGIWR